MKYVGWFYCIGDFELYPYYKGMHYPGCVGDCSMLSGAGSFRCQGGLAQRDQKREFR